MHVSDVDYGVVPCRMSIRTHSSGSMPAIMPICAGGVVAGIAVGGRILLRGTQKMEMEDQEYCHCWIRFVPALSNTTLFPDRCLDREIHALPADGFQGRGVVSIVYTSLTYALAGCVDVRILFRSHVCHRIYPNEFRRAVELGHHYPTAQPHQAGGDGRSGQFCRFDASDGPTRSLPYTASSSGRCSW